ncbi:hypothetical protein DFH06DRAFT_1139783 [Mycena polygramma]|nr:hypothetical protein DFH06DRAFT_1139783 [Mycena polygramma]
MCAVSGFGFTLFSFCLSGLAVSAVGRSDPWSHGRRTYAGARRNDSQRDQSLSTAARLEAQSTARHHNRMRSAVQWQLYAYRVHNVGAGDTSAASIASSQLWPSSRWPTAVAEIGPVIFVPAWVTAISAATLLRHKSPVLMFGVGRLLGCLGLIALSIASSLYNRKGLGLGVGLSAPYPLSQSVLDLLATDRFNGVPTDLNEGPRLWAKIAALSITDVIIPLFTPRQHIPVNPFVCLEIPFEPGTMLMTPEKPMKIANPEQTASIFSLALYFFMDQIIFRAHRQSRLQEDELYPLGDTDASTHLKSRSFKVTTFNRYRSHRLNGTIAVLYLDRFSGNKSQRRIFFGLMRGFQRDIAVLTILLLLRPFTTMAGMYRFTPASPFRPWTGVDILKFKTAGQLCIRGFGFLSFSSAHSSTQSLVRSAAILTQLVFVHSLRTGMIAETTAANVTNAPGTSSPNPGPKKSDGNVVGKINNLVTVDLGNINGARDRGELVIFVPLQLAIGIWFMYSPTTPSSDVARLVESVQKGRLKRTDERVQSVGEAVNVLRMAKLFGCEEKMNARISDRAKIRDAELVWKKRALDMAAGLVNKTLIMGQALDASKVFSSMTVFDLSRCPWIAWTIFLGTDAFKEKEIPPPTASASSDEQIGFRDATFSSTGSLFFSEVEFNLIVGPTGAAGKTSLLMALLGEMHWIPLLPDSSYNLPRESGVAQESWVPNETIRSNIVFDTPFDEECDKKVLHRCALEPDIALFQAGDQSEVGEKGLTLSGGQKARLTLARAVSRELDCILVTHNVALARPIADFVVTFALTVEFTAKDRFQNVRLSGYRGIRHRTHEVWCPGSSNHKEQQVLDKTREEIDVEDPIAKPADGKLIVAEEIQLGHVRASALPHQFFVVMMTWVLGYWAKQYDQRPAKEVNVVLWLNARLDVTPASRIFARVTNDVRAVDDSLASQFWPLATMVVAMMVPILPFPLIYLTKISPPSNLQLKFIAVVIYAPIFIFPGALVGAFGAWIG